MARTVMRFTNPTVRLAATEAGLAAGLAVECQLTSALVQAQPKYQTIPATGCAGEAQSPGATGWQLVLNWLQDWSLGEALSMSWYAFEHDTEEVWFEIVPTGTDTTTTLVGHGFVAAGDFGGTFGDGSVATAAATWPLLEKPDITVPA